jgi:hypothetical protein
MVYTQCQPQRREPGHYHTLEVDSTAYC